MGCGFTWFTWDGDTLATECRDQEERGGTTTHYVFEPGTFIPVAQAVTNTVLDLLSQPQYGDHYSIDRDPVWLHKPTPGPIDAFAWYQCDQLGTPMELTNGEGGIAWIGIYKAWGLADNTPTEKAKKAKIQNNLRFQGQYYDVETGLHYNRYRYYAPQTGRFITRDPIGFNGDINLYTYAPSPTQWLDPLGLARIKNSVEGDRRHRVVNEKLSTKHPNATIQCECYLRDADGNSVYDTDITNTRRRIDTAVIEDGKAHTYEITSLTADKSSQSQKERRIIENGGTYIRDRKTKNLVPIVGQSIIIREP